MPERDPHADAQIVCKQLSDNLFLEALPPRLARLGSFKCSAKLKSDSKFIDRFTTRARDTRFFFAEAQLSPADTGPI